MITRDITSPGQTPVHRFGGAETPTISPGALQSPELSFSADMLSFEPDTPSRRTLQRRQRTSDVTMLSIDMGSRCVLTLTYVLNSALTLGLGWTHRCRETPVPGTKTTWTRCKILCGDTWSPGTQNIFLNTLRGAHPAAPRTFSKFKASISENSSRGSPRVRAPYHAHRCKVGLHY